MLDVDDDADQAAPEAYRAYMTCEASDGWIAEAMAQLSCWLREHDVDVDVSQDTVQEWPDKRLVVRHRQAAGARSLRATLVEQTRHGRWSTELVAHDRRGDGDWLSLVVTNGDGRFVDVPRLSRYLIQALPLTDGSISFIDEPRVIHASSVPDLIDVLCDDERHGLVFAVGTSDSNELGFDSVVARARRWSSQTYGLAQVVVLHPAATALLLADFGDEHAVDPGTIRTYLPGVDPASSLDARRHRYLGARRLHDMSDEAVARMLGGIARRHAVLRPLPTEVVRIQRAFDRLDNKAIVKAMGTEPVRPLSEAIEMIPVKAADQRDIPSVADEATEYLEQIALAKSVLGVTHLDLPSLQRIVELATAPRLEPGAVHDAAQRIEALQDRVERLEDELRVVKISLDDDLEERADLQEDLQRAQAEVRWLRSCAKERGDYEQAFGELPSEQLETYPESFDELLERLDAELPAVIFTGDRRHALKVDDADTLGVAVQHAWDVCLALADYVQARAEGVPAQNVEHYLNNVPEGFRGVPPRKHVPTESSATMQQYGHERVFRVPPEVCRGGSVIMTAHFRLARTGMVSPRLYYLDDIDATGKVYVGYIGPHLRNTQTN